MPKRAALIMAALLSFSVNAQETRVHIPHIATSTALKIGQMIARDQGYDIRDEKQYYFDLHQTADGKPALDGYVTIGFYGGSHIISAISISETTGQTLDM